MRRRPVIIVLAAIGAAALLLAAGMWVAARSAAVEAWVSTRVRELAGPQVHIGAVNLTWWRRPGLVLRDVVLEAPADAPVQGRAAAATVTARIRLLPLLIGRVELGSLRIVGLNVMLDRIDLTPQPGAASPSPPPALAALLRRPPVVRVLGGEVAYAGGAGGAPPPFRLRVADSHIVPTRAGAHVQLGVSLEGGGEMLVKGDVETASDLATVPFSVELGAADIDAATVLAWMPQLAEGMSASGRLRLTARVHGRGTAAVEGDAMLEWTGGVLALAPWQLGAPLRLSGHAAWDGSALAVSNGRLEAAGLDGGPVAAQEIDASFDYDGGALRLDSASCRAAGGVVQLSAGVTLGEPATAFATLDASGLDGHKIAAVLRRFGVHGTLPRLQAPLNVQVAASGWSDVGWTGHVALDTSGEVIWSDVSASGPLRISADVVLPAGATGDVEISDLQLANGHLEVSRIAAGAAAAESVEADFAYAGGRVHDVSLNWQGFGGEWSYQGELPATADAAWRGQLSAKHVHAAALKRALAPNGSTGSPNDNGAASGTVAVEARLGGKGFATADGSAALRLTSEQLVWGGVTVAGPAEVSGTLRVDGGRIAVSGGTAHAAAVHAAGHVAREIATGFSYEGEALRMTSIKANAFDGAWDGSGAVEFGAVPLRWSAAFDVTHVNFDDLLNCIPNRDETDPYSRGAVADFRVQISGNATGSLDGSTDIALRSGSFFLEDLRVDSPSHAGGRFSWRAGKLNLIGISGEGVSAAYGPLETTATVTRFDYAGIPDRLTFSDLRFKSCSGSWSHKGWFTLHAGGPFAGQVNIEGAVPRQLVLMLGYSQVPPAFARLDLDGEFSGRVEKDWIATLQASGSLVLSNGEGPSERVLGAIWDAMAGADEHESTSGHRTTRVEQVTASFLLCDSWVNTADLNLIATDYTATAAGKISLDGHVKMNARIALTARGIQRMLVFASVPLPTAALPPLPPIPATVGGTLSDPVIHPDVSAMPASTAKWLADALLASPRTISGAVVDRLHQIWSLLRYME